MLPATEKNLRSFGILLGIFLTGIAAWILFRSGGARWAFAAGLAAAGALAVPIALLAPARLRPIYVPWMWAAHRLGIAATYVLLTVFYFTVLAPFALVRWKDPLRLRLGGESYWEPYRNAEPTLERFRRPF